jgi:hypothetical protein
MADTLDVLTIAEARSAVALGSDTSMDTVLAAWVTAISRQLDQLCGPVVVRTITAETCDGGASTIRLRYTPVSSITSIAEYLNTTSTTLTAESNTTKTVSNYRVDLRSGTIRRRNTNSDACFADGRGNIEVTYVAGRAANTAAVDSKFKQAASMMLRAAWVGEQASGSQTFEQGFDPTLLGPKLLNRVQALLEGEMRESVAVL